MRRHLSAGKKIAKAQEKARRKALVAALLALPEWQRQAFFLRRFDDLPSARIAEMTGQPVPAVDAAIAAAIRSTQELLRGEP